jgi:antibiotic biosynthesis monooxygenase (ABM) superfamily enzyme
VIGVRARLTLVAWCAVYPMVTALLGLFEPWLFGMPLWVKTFPVSLVMVPSMVYVVMPLAHSWIKADIVDPSV